MTKPEGAVKYDEATMTLISGIGYCYRSPDAAMRQSRRSTTNPGVTALDVAGESVYLANGDCWIDDAGRQGRHLYGRGGRYINLVPVED